MMTETELQAAADDLVRANVNCCLSSLVSTLAKDAYNLPQSGSEELAAQAAELCAPVEDYEEAATQEGYLQSDGEHRAIGLKADIDAGNFDATYDSWQDACEVNGIEPYQWEIYEHWAVTDWLAEKLAARGERVDTDFAGLCVWARTTTGQAISMDGVIREITQEVHAA